MYAPSPEDSALQPLPRPPARRAAEVRRAVRLLITRFFFGVAAVCSVAVAVLFALLAQTGLAEPRLWTAAMFAAIGAYCAWAALNLDPRGAWVERAMFGVLAAMVLALAVSAVMTGWGLAAPGLGIYGLFVCLMCAAANRRMGLAMAGLALAALAVLALLQPAPPPGAPTLLASLVGQVALVGTGLACGLLIAYVVARYVRSADDREQRFRGLLAIAADAYWEIDEKYRLLAATNQRDPSAGLAVGEGLGCLPWDLPQFRCEAETLDALLADLDTRIPFHEVPVQWLDDEHGLRELRVSGEPRFDHRGVFTGYWGVARDVTDDLAARQALHATETRYHALFERLPTPLVMHDDGRIVDANPAAVALLGYPGLQAMLGQDLLASYDSGDSRERERRRLDRLLDLPPGEALPVADFRLVARGGRRIAVRATGVRVDTAEGPATLTIFVDETERRAAEEAVRRSETMLSHLVATSPDVITLTDMTTGRYAMVNRTFERLTGWTAAEVVGRTSLELGIWHQPEDRERFVDLIRHHGSAGDLPTRFRAKGGQTVSMLVSGARFAMDRRDYLVINARDVTEVERNRLEREAILQNASIGIAVTRDRCFVLANPAFERMVGWPPGALAGQPGRVVWPSDEAYAEVGALAAEWLSRGEQLECERTLARRDGSRFTARILAKAIDPAQATQGGTVWMLEDVTERRQFEQALADARDAAEAASRAKSAFLANTSHELRTPLNGILGLSRLARDPGLAEPLRTQYLDQITESAQGLAEIISDILDLSKIEAGKLDLEVLPFDLGELLAGMERAYATLAETRGLALTLELGDGVTGTVLGDAQRVRQILGNYLGNAIKFTARGEVRLRAQRGTGDLVRLQVQDTGPGIDRATQARLFLPFTQADESTTRRYGGTGLGLSICRELATLMGGEVGVVSEPGKGALFWADLPLPPCAAPALETAPASGLPAALDRESVALRGLRVLMVEDNPVNMMIAVAMLERWGVLVEQAGDGQQALEAVQRAETAGHPFDAVLMDVQMPVMGGHEATRSLRQQAGPRRLPIIALTAAALVSEREAALAAGMDDFLTKPIDADRLHDTLVRWAGAAERGSSPA